MSTGGKAKKQAKEPEENHTVLFAAGNSTETANEIILDSGASVHITNRHDLLIMIL